jgi:hypothetical protein
LKEAHQHSPPPSAQFTIPRLSSASGFQGLPVSDSKENGRRREVAISVVDPAGDLSVIVFDSLRESTSHPEGNKRTTTDV